MKKENGFTGKYSPVQQYREVNGTSDDSLVTEKVRWKTQTISAEQSVVLPRRHHHLRLWQTATDWEGESIKYVVRHYHRDQHHRVERQCAAISSRVSPEGSKAIDCRVTAMVSCKSSKWREELPEVSTSRICCQVCANWTQPCSPASLLGSLL